MTCKGAKQKVVEVAIAIFSTIILSSFLFTNDSDSKIVEVNFLKPQVLIMNHALTLALLSSLTILILLMIFIEPNFLTMIFIELNFLTIFQKKYLLD